MSKRKKIILIVLVVCSLFLLTSCSSNNLTLPIGTFKEESGILKILVWPIAWFMHLVSTIFPEGTGTFGWAIIITTIVVRTLAWPIYAKTNDMSLKMAVAQPEMQKIQEKYGQRKDPQGQQLMQQEMMKVYKKYKISMLGCLMPFIQMPIFLAMFNVVRRIVIPTKLNEDGTVYRQAIFLISDTDFLGMSKFLSQGVYGESAAALWSINFFMGIVLSLLVGATMFLLNKISQKQPSYVKQKPNQQNQMSSTMKIFNYMMIGMMTVTALSNNSLAFYWLIGNLYSIVQTLISRKLNEKKFEKMKSDVDKLL